MGARDRAWRDHRSVVGNPASSRPEDVFGAVLRATQYAIERNVGDVISMSFGGPETCVPAAFIRGDHEAFEDARRKQITVLAIAHDSGAAEPLCDASGNLIAWGPGVQYPASDPLVTTVGGTSLFTDDRFREVRARDDLEHPDHLPGQSLFGATGGGFSRIFARPEYQDNVPSETTFRGRGVPDVAYNADSNTGVITVCSVCGAGPDAVIAAGGTSAGAPQWAGIIALI